MRGELRILQAGMPRFQEALFPIADMPAACRRICAEAKERSLSKALQAAVSQNVDLVLITGTMESLEQEPRLAAVLREQFQKIEKAKIPVVWLTPKVESWPSLLPLPQNVCVLAAGQSRSLQIGERRTNLRICSLPEQAGTRSAIAGKLEFEIQLHRKKDSEYVVDYQHLTRSEQLQLRSLPLQRRSADDHDLVGAHLVELDRHGILQSRLLPTETVSWRSETLKVTATSTLESIRSEMTQRQLEIGRRQHSEQVLIQWTATGCGPLWNQLIDSAVVRDLMNSLQSVGTLASHRAWSCQLALLPDSEQWQHWAQSSAIEVALQELASLSSLQGEWQQQLSRIHDWRYVAKEGRDGRTMTLPCLPMALRLVHLFQEQQRNERGTGADHHQANGHLIKQVG